MLNNDYEKRLEARKIHLTKEEKEQNRKQFEEIDKKLKKLHRQIAIQDARAWNRMRWVPLI